MKPIPFTVVGFSCVVLVLSAAHVPAQAQAVPPTLESPAARPPVAGPDGQMLPGMPRFHDPAPYDIDEHTGYKQIFDGRSLAGWDGDPTLWHVEDGVIVGETDKPRGNSYISYQGGQYKDFDLKLQMKIERGGGGGIQYRSKAGVPWTRAQPAGETPTKWLLTGPQADFWYPVRPAAAAYTGQWYSENTMQGILAYRVDR